MPYSQLTRGQRCRVEALKASGFTQAQIAERVGVHQSTISRELGRNGPESRSCGHRADLAAAKALLRHRRPPPRIKDSVWAAERRGRIPNRQPIHAHPKAADDRSREGDWECDTVVGAKRKGVLATAAERRSRFFVVAYAGRKTKDAVGGALRPTSRFAGASLSTTGWSSPATWRWVRRWAQRRSSRTPIRLGGAARTSG